MTRIEKIYRRLDELEMEFCTALTKELELCAAGRNDLLFCSTPYLPDGYPRHFTIKADALLEACETIRHLKEKVAEPFAATLAAQFQAACRKWADHSDHHRGSAQSIAVKLLSLVRSPDNSP